MDKRHPVKACKARLENPLLPCGHPGKADLLTGLVFISYLGDAYQTQPQTWPGLGLHCLSDCLSLGWSSTDVFVPRGLSIEAVAKTTANKLHVQQNRSRCWLTCLSLAFLQGTTRETWMLGEDYGSQVEGARIYLILLPHPINCSGLQVVWFLKMIRFSIKNPILP